MQKIIRFGGLITLCFGLALAAFGQDAGIGAAPTSVATVQPTPSTVTYGLNVLTLFPTYTRASYLATFGVQAPAYDPTYPPKVWFDSTQACTPGATATATYTVIQGQANFVPLTIPACEAANVNLQGWVTYTAYSVAASGLTIVPTAGATAQTTATVSPTLLSTQAQAQALQASIPALAGLPITQETVGGFYKYVYADTETRRLWQIGPTAGGLYFNVGILLGQMNAAGVGAPGTWSVDANGGMVWTPTAAVDGSADTRVAIPVPVRALTSNESIVSGMMGSVQIQNNTAAAAAASTSAGFSVADRAALNQILTLMKQITGTP